MRRALPEHKPGRKPKRHAIPAADAKWIAKILKGKIPAKFDLPKAFLETLFAINAMADLSEALRPETNGLYFRVKQTGEELEAEKKAKSAADERAGALQSEADQQGHVARSAGGHSPLGEHRGLRGSRETGSRGNPRVGR